VRLCFPASSSTLFRNFLQSDFQFDFQIPKCHSVKLVKSDAAIFPMPFQRLAGASNASSTFSSTRKQNAFQFLEERIVSAALKVEKLVAW
jgi:hypothetical protein